MCVCFFFNKSFFWSDSVLFLTSQSNQHSQFSSFLDIAGESWTKCFDWAEKSERVHWSLSLRPFSFLLLLLSRLLSVHSSVVPQTLWALRLFLIPSDTSAFSTSLSLSSLVLKPQWGCYICRSYVWSASWCSAKVGPGSCWQHDIMTCSSDWVKGVALCKSWHTCLVQSEISCLPCLFLPKKLTNSLIIKYIQQKG